jgi:ADP-ribosylglycohydrolase
LPPNSSVSDDTQLTLATCESIVETGGVHPQHIAETFAKWFAACRFSGLGSSTLKALRDLSSGVHWALSGNRGEYAAGNGAAMRIAPLAFLLDPFNPHDRTVIRDVCRITHHNDEAYAGALAVVAALRSIMADPSAEQINLLAAAADSLPDSAVRDRIRELQPLSLPPAEVAAQFGTSGWVVHTVPLALYCAQHCSDFMIFTMARVAQFGGDTDTIASITAQLRGAKVGIPSCIPGVFSDVIQGHTIVDTVNRFAHFLVGNNP